MKISPARLAAFEILRRIETERAYSSVLLPVFEADLGESDRRLCHELVLGTLRRQIYLDRVVESFAKGKKLDIEVRLALRLGLYQLYFLDKIPQYSAINESVNLVQAARKTSAKGFVNAILRKASLGAPKLAYANEIDRISVETSHPQWLVDKWITDLEIAEAEAVGKANNHSPNTAFRLLAAASDEARKFAGTAKQSEFVKGAYVANGQGSELNRLAVGGEIYIQDEGSQMVARAIEVPPNGRFLDVCAAPGGKTGLISLLNPTARMIAAGDIHRSRIQILRDNCRHQRTEDVAIVQYDATIELPFDNASFDSVLVDAPCSGTGTVRRNPEIRYHLSESDFPDLFAKQLAILTNASKLVKVGGSVTYSTCSIEREENEAVCSSFATANMLFEPVNPEVDARFFTPEGFVRTSPSRDGMDGFFIAKFRRVS
ncbi:MAG: 16S rRNA (cytosine(967)-C(5))-methyltransferase RsmB [Pyrinomonadaceae bacterium]